MSSLRNLVTLSAFATMAFAFFLAPAMPVQAGTATDETILETLGGAAREPFGADATGQTQLTPGRLVGRIVRIFLGFIGTIAFGYFLFGGYLWLTAGGNEDQVDKAKDYLKNASIGILIVVMAYSASFYIVDAIFQASR